MAETRAEIVESLTSKSLEQYIQIFDENDLLTKDFFTVTPDELQRMGIKSVGHSKKILGIIKRHDMLINPPPNRAVSAAPSTEQPAETSSFLEMHAYVSANLRPKWLESSTRIRECQQSVLRECDPHISMVVEVAGRLFRQREEGEGYPVEIGLEERDGRWRVLGGDAARTGWNPKDKRSAKHRCIAVVREKTDTEEYAYPRLLFPADMFTVAHSNGVVKVVPVEAASDDAADRFWEVNRRQTIQMFTGSGKTLMQIIDSLMSAQPPKPTGEGTLFGGGGGGAAGGAAGANSAGAAGANSAGGSEQHAHRKVFLWTSNTAAKDNVKSYFRKKMEDGTFQPFDDHSDQELKKLHLVKTLGFHPHVAYDICKHTVFTDEFEKGRGRGLTAQHPIPADVWIVVGNPTIVGRRIDAKCPFVRDFTHLILDEADFGGQNAAEEGDKLWGTILKACPGALVTYYSGTLANTQGDELRQPLVQVTYSDCIRANAVKELNLLRVTRDIKDGEAPLTIQVPSEGGGGAARIIHIEPERDIDELKEYRKYFARNKQFSKEYIKAATQEWLKEQERTGIPGQFIIFVPPGDGRDAALDASYLTDIKSYYELVKEVMAEESFKSPLTGEPIVVGMSSSNYVKEDSYTAFCKWEVDVLVTVNKLGRSFDDPLVTTILFLRDPGTADTNRKQMIGRGLRILTPEKMKEIVLATDRFAKLKGREFPKPTDEKAPVCLVIETEVQEDAAIYERFQREEKHDLIRKNVYIVNARPLLLMGQHGGGNGSARPTIEILPVKTEATEAVIRFKICVPKGANPAQKFRLRVYDVRNLSDAGILFEAVATPILPHVSASQTSGEPFKPIDVEVPNLDRGRQYRCTVEYFGALECSVEFTTKVETNRESNERRRKLTVQSKTAKWSSDGKTLLIWIDNAGENLKGTEKWKISLKETPTAQSRSHRYIERGDPRMVKDGEKQKRPLQKFNQKKTLSSSAWSTHISLTGAHEWQVRLPQNWPFVDSGNLEVSFSIVNSASHFNVPDNSIVIYYDTEAIPRPKQAETAAGGSAGAGAGAGAGGAGGGGGGGGGQ